MGASKYTHFADIFLRLHLSQTGDVWSQAILAFLHGSQEGDLPFLRRGTGVPLGTALILPDIPRIAG
jgi:hypothetical protein